MAPTITLADLVARLRYRVDDSGLATARAKVDSLGKSIEGIGARADAGLRGGLAKGLDRATTSLTAGLGPAGGQAKALLDGLGTSALESGSALKAGVAAGAVGAGLLLTKFGVDGIRTLSSLTSEVRQFQRVSGADAEGASRLVTTLKLLGIEPSNASRAFGILSKNIENNSARLRELGIDVAHNKNGTTDLVGTLFAVSDAYKASTDQATKNTIALTAFGRGGLELVPILARGRDGIRELFAEADKHGLVFSQQDLDNARDFTLATRELRQALQGLEVQGAKALVPLLTRLAEVEEKVVNIVTFVESHSGGFLSRASRGLGETIERTVLGPFKPLVDASDKVNSLRGKGKAEAEAEDASAATAGLTGSLDELGPSAQQADTALGQLAEGLGLAASSSKDFELNNVRVKSILDSLKQSTDDRIAALLASAGAQTSDAEAATSFADALRTVTERERELTEARAGRALASRDAISVERALNATEDAKTSIVEHERALADARAGRGPKARELADAERDLSRARQDAGAAHGLAALATANERVADAEERLRRAREDGGQTADITDATESLSRARLNAKEADLNLSDAREQAAGREKHAEEDLFTARTNALNAALASAKAAQEVAENEAKIKGVPLSAAEGARVYRDRLAELAGPLSPGSELRQSIEATIARIDALVTPPTRTLRFDANTKPALDAINPLKTLIDSVLQDAQKIVELGSSQTGIGRDLATILAAAATAPPFVPKLPSNVPSLVPAGATPGTLRAPATTTTSTTTSVQNNYTTITGVREDEVARRLSERQALDAARQR